MPRQDWIRLIRQRAPLYKVDPRAALAVAQAEGLSGLVGDQGHAFGPFQLNDAGGVLTGRPGNHRGFAESQQGIDWALQRIGQVAGGLSGHQAIDAIVRRFERPAAPDAEVQRAGAYYGKLGGGAATPSPFSSAAPMAVRPAAGGIAAPTETPLDLRRQLALSLLRANQPLAEGGQADYSPVVKLAMQQQAAPPPAVAEIPNAPVGRPVTAEPLPYKGKTVVGYPLARPAKVIGSPYHGTHTLYGNWESDNAVDLATPVGTPVVALHDGTIGSQIGAINSRDPHLEGLRLHLVTPSDEFYYAHLSRIVVKPGQKVKAGQVIGYSGAANGVAHLHLGQREGNPLELVGGRSV